jgi:hypothetical protein
MTERERTMQTFIKPKKKQDEEKIEIRIDTDVLDSLRAYAQFLDSPQGYVVSEILRKAFRKDRAFAAWRKTATPAASNDNVAVAVKRSRPS